MTKTFIISNERDEYENEKGNNKMNQIRKKKKKTKMKNEKLGAIQVIRNIRMSEKVSHELFLLL